MRVARVVSRLSRHPSYHSAAVTVIRRDSPGITWWLRIGITSGVLELGTCTRYLGPRAQALVTHPFVPGSSCLAGTVGPDGSSSSISNEREMPPPDQPTEY